MADAVDRLSAQRIHPGFISSSAGDALASANGTSTREVEGGTGAIYGHWWLRGELGAGFLFFCFVLI